jgi:hypothetical protein
LAPSNLLRISHFVQKFLIETISSLNAKNEFFGCSLTELKEKTILKPSKLQPRADGPPNEEEKATALTVTKGRKPTSRVSQQSGGSLSSTISLHTNKEYT